MNPIKQLLAAIRRWRDSKAKAGPGGGTTPIWSTSASVDAYRRIRPPTPTELLNELKNTAYTCASINASACARMPPRLYVSTGKNQPAPKCLTKSLTRDEQSRIKDSRQLSATIKDSVIKEVAEHPLLTLLAQVNPHHNSFDLWELTTYYQETVGSAFWLLEKDNLGMPTNIWTLPAHQVTPKRDGQTGKLTAYEHRVGSTTISYLPDEIIHFRYPDPKDPYHSGLSPLRACWENASMGSEYLAFKRATWDNSAIPGAVISPDEVIGEEERERLESQINQKFRRGGAGSVLVGESNLKVDVLSHSMGDLAALAEYGSTIRDIANAFHVPLAFLSSDTNLANLQAAEHQHMSKAIAPRLQRRDEKLNEQLIPLYDTSGRLWLQSDNPIPFNEEAGYKQKELSLKYGILTINEVRADSGLPSVPWGDVPWLPIGWAPADLPLELRLLLAPDSGRAKPTQAENEEGGNE